VPKDGVCYQRIERRCVGSVREINLGRRGQVTLWRWAGIAQRRLYISAAPLRACLRASRRAGQRVKQDLKQYAETIFEEARAESLRRMRGDISKFLGFVAIRGVDMYGREIPVRLAGPDISQLLAIYDDHIERSMLARITSYQKAFSESGQTPSEQELSDIWGEAQAVRVLEIQRAVKSLKDFIASRGGSPFVPDEAHVEQNSGQAYERVFQRWKIWKAKAQLSVASPKTEERNKQLDVLLPLYAKSELDKDIISFGSTPDELSPLSLLFMDLDKFKAINDTLGHEAGNRALRAFADVLLRVSGSKGAAYRFGGDEFCVLLPNHSLDEALAVAERIRRDLRAIRTQELTEGLSTSIGAASIPESTTDIAKLCELADRAMYASKKAGGNRVSIAEQIT
jgi:diguanylate cyclase (GGDEF)-like protein